MVDISAVQAVLLPLRQELTLTPGAATPAGEPTWTLQDPVNNHFFQLGWAAFEMLSRWHLKDPQLIIAVIQQNTTLRIGMEDIQALQQFLAQQNLLLSYTPDDSARLTRHAAATRTQGARWLLQNYLFFRVPLVRPGVFLDWFAPYFARVFSAGFWWAICAVLVLGVFLVSRQWDSFTHTFAAYSGLQGLLGIGLALSFAKILHECGHALTAHRYGCRVPTMGLAFLVMIPVLYTDTTDAWKLSSRRQRLQIGAAGMLAEVVLAVIATLAWSFLPDGPLRAGVFLLATSTWLLTLAINASPFMRFDGYFLLADWLNLPNLHERSFALGRWWWREKLFGWNDPIPEHFSPRRHAFLIAFAFATALYRALLFLGIALLVYHLFFKLLGVLLMLVELGWFIAYPVQRELKVWWQRRQDMHWHFHTYRTVALAVFLIALVAIPWQSSIRAPAVIGAEQAQGLYAVSAAVVKSEGIAEGETVAAGQILLQLDSPDLRHRLILAQTKEQQLRWQLEQQSLTPFLQKAGPALRERWQGATEAVKGLTERMQQLTIVAPYDGIIVERNLSLTAGTWVAAGEKLFHIVSPKGIKGEAYLNESDLLRLKSKNEIKTNTDIDTETKTARFVAQESGFGSVTCTIEDIDKLNLSQLDQAYVASQYGGGISTQSAKDGRLIPLHATFRLRFNECTGNGQKLKQELAGTATLYGERKSLFSRTFIPFIASLHSESSF